MTRSGRRMCATGTFRLCTSGPLAACRAALVATLLPDPGDDAERRDIYRRLAGEVSETNELKRVTQGGILHWGRESGPDLDWFRERIRDAYSGRAPKVLDPFAGGGAIPLEALRLGCEATAVDINPVAWFILKCTLEYPQRLAGQVRPLPSFALRDRTFMEAFLKAKGFKGRRLKRQLKRLGVQSSEDSETATLWAMAEPSLREGNLAWHVRAWGRWVLARVRKRLAHRYPTYAEFQAAEPGGESFEPRSPVMLEPGETGQTDTNTVNSEFNKDWMDDSRNPRWIAKPTVAYLWARTVKCKHCRAIMPLLKTCWLARTAKKRVVLTVRPNADRAGV